MHPILLFRAFLGLTSKNFATGCGSKVLTMMCAPPAQRWITGEDSTSTAHFRSFCTPLLFIPPSIHQTLSAAPCQNYISLKTGAILFSTGAKFLIQSGRLCIFARIAHEKLES